MSHWNPPPPPFPGVEPTLSHPESGTYGYLCRNPDAVVWRYAEGCFFNLESAEWQATDADAILRRSFGPKLKLVFVHDFSFAAGYTPEARKRLMSYAVQIKHEIERAVLVSSTRVPTFGFGISAAAMALRLVGMSIEIADDADRAFAKLGLHPASR